MRRAIGMAQSSPMVSGCTRWNRRTKRWSVSGSKRLSVCATNAQARPRTRGIALQRLLRELGELAVEPAREVLADLPHHLVHDVEVVDEPFRGRRDRPLPPGSPRRSRDSTAAGPGRCRARAARGGDRRRRRPGPAAARRAPRAPPGARGSGARPGSAPGTRGRGATRRWASGGPGYACYAQPPEVRIGD